MKEGSYNRATNKRRNNWLTFPYVFSQNWLKFQTKEEAAGKQCNNEVDRISELCDDILISIISKLTFREATRTSILSTRWRHLYTHTTRLDFPPFHPEQGLIFEHLKDIRETKFPNHVNTINRTLDLHKGGSVLKEFRIHMHCHSDCATIDKWLEFALAREVEIIDIQMLYIANAIHSRYTFGLVELNKKKSLLPGFKCLKELSLSGIHVDDGEVELLLSNFPRLESLSIANSDRLKNVFFVGGSLVRLVIYSALYVKSIVIDNMINLVSLTCDELPSTYILRLSNVPKLTEFKTTEIRNNSLAVILPRIPCSIHDQLRLLRLSTADSFSSVWQMSLPIPQLINVKHLELEVRLLSYSPLTELYPLIEACRSLEKVEIKLKQVSIDKNLHEVKHWKWRPTRIWSQNLKHLKVSGYLGRSQELGFVSTVIENAVALKELVVEPCDETFVSPHSNETHNIGQEATARALQQLRPITPNSVNLVILGLSKSTCNRGKGQKFCSTKAPSWWNWKGKN